MKTTLIPLPLLLLSSLTARAAVSSLAIPSVDREAAFSYNQWLATSFISPPDGVPMAVDSLSLKVACAVPNQYVFVAITGTIAGRPALNDIRVVADTAPMLPPIILDQVFILTLRPRLDNAPPILFPGEVYWIVAGSSAPDWGEDLPAGLFHWSFANSTSGTQSEDGWAVGTATATGNSGGQNWSVENSTPYSFSLALTAVPEPGGAALLIMTFFMMIRRRSLSCV